MTPRTGLPFGGVAAIAVVMTACPGVDHVGTGGSVSDPNGHIVQGDPKANNDREKSRGPQKCSVTDDHMCSQLCAHAQLTDEWERAICPNSEERAECRSGGRASNEQLIYFTSRDEHGGVIAQLECSLSCVPIAGTDPGSF